VHGDICDVAALEAVFARCDIERVIHFAAESHVDRSILGPLAFFDTNVTGTLNLLAVARKHWDSAPGRRMFLHISTDEVYGTLAPNDPPFNERTHRTVRMPRRKQPPITWCARGNTESGCGSARERGGLSPPGYSTFRTLRCSQQCL